MSKQYYECHITFLNQDHVDEFPDSWILSRIDGDSLLGEGVKSYLTKQFSTKHDLNEVISFVELAADRLRRNNIEVLRTKVELVVYDSKQTAEELENEDPIRRALRSFVDDFETDFTIHGDIVDTPPWGPLTRLYQEAKEALDQ